MFRMWFPYVPIKKMFLILNCTVWGHLLTELNNQLLLDEGTVINNLSPEVENERAKINFTL